MSDPLSQPEPWPGYWEGVIAPVPADATSGLQLSDKPWLYAGFDLMPFSVVALVINQDRKVLAVSRKDDHRNLGLPGGKTDGEEAEDAIRRELEEETGLQGGGFKAIYQAPCPSGAKKPSLVFYVPFWRGVAENREGAVTLWVPPQKLLEPQHTFSGFNRLLFAHVKKDFPLMSWLP